MLEKNIPEHIDPFRYAEQSLTLSGVMPLAAMTRIANNLNRLDGNVKVDFKFSVDDQKITNIKGKLEVVLSLQCQRCMEPFTYEIIANFNLGVVNTLEEANALPEHYEPVIAKDCQLSLYDVVEDELLLSMPVTPRHDPKDCKVTVAPAQAGAVIEKGKNPFQVLEALKQRQ